MADFVEEEKKPQSPVESPVEASPPAVSAPSVPVGIATQTTPIPPKSVARSREATPEVNSVADTAQSMRSDRNASSNHTPRSLPTPQSHGHSSSHKDSHSQREGHKSGRSRAPPRVAVVGGGPVGCTAALALHRLGYRVDVFEGRPDPRIEVQMAGDSLRSINLALSARGIGALVSISPTLAQRVATGFVPMTGRMVHDRLGNQHSVAYGVYGEQINSISRMAFNLALVAEVDNAGIPIHFDCRLAGATFKPLPELTFLTPDGQLSGQPDFVVGCDGTFSRLRSELGRLVEFDFSQTYVDHYYLELTFPAGQAPDPLYAFDPNHLHIWPRGDFMLIALPNRNGSFTVTLFASRDMFNIDLADCDSFMELMNREFPDACDVIGQEELARSFEHPRGRLISVKCGPYHYEDKLILLGDAAHSMVPFYGQGLNSGLEDVRRLMELLARLPRSRAFAAYTALRKPDLDAICELSLENYREMRDGVTRASFIFRKWIDRAFMALFGSRWIPLYTMVAFRADIPYSEAQRRGRRQDLIVKRLVQGGYCLLGLAAFTIADRIGLWSAICHAPVAFVRSLLNGTLVQDSMECVYRCTGLGLGTAHKAVYGQ